MVISLKNGGDGVVFYEIQHFNKFNKRFLDTYYIK